MTYMQHQQMAWVLDVLIRQTSTKDAERLKLLREARHHHALMAEDPCNRNYRPTGRDQETRSLKT